LPYPHDSAIRRREGSSSVRAGQHAVRLLWRLTDTGFDITCTGTQSVHDNCSLAITSHRQGTRNGDVVTTRSVFIFLSQVTSRFETASVGGATHGVDRVSSNAVAARCERAQLWKGA